ncbi:Undecaprenyl phosphate-alpha-4-amino-4-deoxy-L-arabinose arabinosyl transferase [Halomonas sp. THAF12]|uniref:ArnT family glycosyltransferase n=1 Tax=Halomonas sp. THAF12 TaxID=2587849 RepID=UPI001267BF45|nr:glycosyltransferase family 39 protein [Halomonas sp. THAF12]QFT83929.1 Undecaprenyl phosphate-alpha-4-amino-4-deoxy-L-arabinose arabinosyl transferase [Halomonas sp. THAF12]
MTRPAYLHRLPSLSWWWLLGLAAIFLGVGLGLRDPWPADEPRFALNALEMLRTGQFWIPFRGGEPYPDKPPIFMWAIAAGIQLTGSVRLGFLLPSLLGALATLALVMDLSSRLYGRRMAWLAGLALLSCFQFGLQARTAQIDMLVTGFITLGAYGLMRHALLGPDRRWWLIGCAGMGLGVLTKGVGFLPLLMVPFWALLAWRGQATRPTWRDLGLGLAVLLGVVLLWVGPMAIITSLSDDPALTAYRDNLLFKQTGERYADSWHHLKPWYYFLAEVIPWAWLPLVLALPWLVPAWWRRGRRLDARVLLPLGGLVMIIAFFSLSPGKRGVYLLPTLPLLVLASAPMLAGLLCRPRLQWLGGAVLALFGVIFLGAGVLGWLGLPALAELAETHGVVPWTWWSLLGLVALGLLAWGRPRRGLVMLSAWLAVFWLSWSTWGYALMDHARSPRDLMATIVAQTGPEAWLAMPDFDEEFLLQARQPMVHFGYHTPDTDQFARAFAWLEAAPDQRWMLVPQHRDEAIACADLGQARDLGMQNSETWWLIPGTAFAACRGDAEAAPLYVAPTTPPDEITD